MEMNKKEREKEKILIGKTKLTKNDNNEHWPT